MISTNNISSGSLRRVLLSLFSSKQCIINSYEIRFCNILDNQGLGKCYEPNPLFRISLKPRPIIANYLVDCNDDDEDDDDNGNDDVKQRR